MTDSQLNMGRIIEVRAKLHATFGDSADVIFRDVSFADKDGLIVFIEAMSDPEPMINSLHEATSASSMTEVAEQLLSQGLVLETMDYDRMVAALLSGDSLLFVEGFEQGLVAGTRNIKERNVEEPISESVVRGPREGFVESLRENTALIRRRLQNANLRLEMFRIGNKTSTSVGMMYLNGVAEGKVVNRVRETLSKANVDRVLESNYIEELLEDDKWTPFPTVFNTERSDVITAEILEGKVAIFVEGTPFVLTVPAYFIQFLQSSEDYYQRAGFSSFIRMLRFFCFAVALLTPSFYIAITTFHQEMIPTTLLISLIGQREGVPFPAVIEALIMEITFEILREAGIRLPKSIGQSVSIVGTLVIGQAAVDAGLVSAAMVIVVSLTAIANFALPTFNMGISVRLLRFMFMLFSASFGLYGMIIGLIMLGLHMCSLESVGMPYMSSLAPFSGRAQRDVFVRLKNSYKPGGSNE